MTQTTTSFDPIAFLDQMRGVAFSKVGAYMVIRSHMLLAPDHCMTKGGIQAALRTRSAFGIALLNEVIDELFTTHANGSISCPDLDASTAISRRAE